MYRRAGNLARTAVSSTGKKKEVAQTKSSKIVSAITRQKEKERFDRIGQSPAHNEEFVAEEDPCWKGYTQVGMKKKGGREVPNCVPSKGVPKAKGYKKEEVEIEEAIDPKGAKRQDAAKDKKKIDVFAYDRKIGRKNIPPAPKNEEVELDEKTLTPAETKKKEDIVMSMKKKGDFSKYGERAKEVMYATATKQAKKLAEADMPQETQDTDKRAKAQQKQKLLQILQQKERAVRAGMTDISASYEVEGEQLDERRREEKGTPRKPRDKAFELVSKSMGAGRMGVQPRGKKKVPGEKKPSTQVTPAEKVKRRRDSAQRAQDAMHSPRD